MSGLYRVSRCEQVKVGPSMNEGLLYGPQDTHATDVRVLAVLVIREDENLQDVCMHSLANK